MAAESGSSPITEPISLTNTSSLLEPVDDPIDRNENDNSNVTSSRDIPDNRESAIPEDNDNNGVSSTAPRDNRDSSIDNSTALMAKDRNSDKVIRPDPDNDRLNPDFEDTMWAIFTAMEDPMEGGDATRRHRPLFNSRPSNREDGSGKLEETSTKPYENEPIKEATSQSVDVGSPLTRSVNVPAETTTTTTKIITDSSIYSPTEFGSGDKMKGNDSGSLSTASVDITYEQSIRDDSFSSVSVQKQRTTISSSVTAEAATTSITRVHRTPSSRLSTAVLPQTETSLPIDNRMSSSATKNQRTTVNSMIPDTVTSATPTVLTSAARLPATALPKNETLSAAEVPTTPSNGARSASSETSTIETIPKISTEFVIEMTTSPFISFLTSVDRKEKTPAATGSSPTPFSNIPTTAVHRGSIAAVDIITTAVFPERSGITESVEEAVSRIETTSHPERPEATSGEVRTTMVPESALTSIAMPRTRVETALPTNLTEFATTVVQESSTTVVPNIAKTSSVGNLTSVFSEIVTSTVEKFKTEVASEMSKPIVHESTPSAIYNVSEIPFPNVETTRGSVFTSNTRTSSSSPQSVRTTTIPTQTSTHQQTSVNPKKPLSAEINPVTETATVSETVQGTGTEKQYEISSTSAPSETATSAVSSSTAGKNGSEESVTSMKIQPTKPSSTSNKETSSETLGVGTYNSTSSVTKVSTPIKVSSTTQQTSIASQPTTTGIVLEDTMSYEADMSKGLPTGENIGETLKKSQSGANFLRISEINLSEGSVDVEFVALFQPGSEVDIDEIGTTFRGEIQNGTAFSDIRVDPESAAFEGDHLMPFLKHTHAHKYTRSLSHSHARAHTHTHTHTHTHIYI
ncbi:hypothetical protein LSH36_457g03001 [Paralvinella palmiformis]|uniref:Uncharacterized protein n=1 Tax=Paralvinella palmiformis TaxID=53620 RepID=A0AAD9MXC4_9ANNE|nr:hypothetical protein LSH36_457g03001 [Paralvinella palmiformis]